MYFFQTTFALHGAVFQFVHNGLRFGFVHRFADLITPLMFIMRCGGQV